MDLVDEEHRGLFARFEALAKGIHEKAAESDLEELVRFLSEYASTHFEDEEKLMWMAGYPRLPEHRLIHEEMRLHIARMVGATGAGSDDVLSRALDFLTMWLIEHIHTEDQAMARYVKSQLQEQPLPRD